MHAGPSGGHRSAERWDARGVAYSSDGFHGEYHDYRGGGNGGGRGVYDQHGFFVPDRNYGGPLGRDAPREYWQKR